MENYELKPAQFKQLLDKLKSEYDIEYAAVTPFIGHTGKTEFTPFVTAYVVTGKNEEEQIERAKKVMQGKEKALAVVQVHYNKFDKQKPELYVLLGKSLSSEIKDALEDLGIKPVAAAKQEKKLANKPL
ncbi:MAG: hypothetical protein V1492_02915 [Candidatus Micrarchaeota archaeon]